MHFTLHLTDACNLRCRYCYVRQSNHYMTLDTAKAVVDLAAEDPGHHGLIFFGGEPLLQRQLIYDTVAYAQSLFSSVRAAFRTDAASWLPPFPLPRSAAPDSVPAHPGFPKTAEPEIRRSAPPLPRRFCRILRPGCPYPRRSPPQGYCGGLRRTAPGEPYALRHRMQG